VIVSSNILGVSYPIPKDLANPNSDRAY